MSAKPSRRPPAEGKRGAAKRPAAMTKAQMTADLAGRASLSKSQVSNLLTALGEVIEGELRAGRPVTIPGLVKIRTVRKEATPARTMTSPFTGLPMLVKAKPARNVVKVSALKGLKVMA